MNVLGISRAAIYSPHSEDRDARVFSGLAAELQQRGHHVRTLTEDAFSADEAGLGSMDAVFTMGRHRSVAIQLQTWKEMGVTVINDPHGLLALNRRGIYRACRELGIGVAPQLSRQDLEEDNSSPVFPCWLKRDDGCAQQADDVCFVPDEPALRQQLARFAERGVQQYVMSAHLRGDLIKFYGVADTPFFFVKAAKTTGGFSKFGLEQYNDAYGGYAFDTVRWQQQMNRLANRLQIDVYGGDAVVDETGACRLIDFNDWPSFSCCLDDAVSAIADILEQRGQFRKDKNRI